MHVETFLVFSPKRRQFTFAFKKNVLLDFGEVSTKIKTKTDKYMHSLTSSYKVLLFSILCSKELNWLVFKS